MKNRALLIIVLVGLPVLTIGQVIKDLPTDENGMISYNGVVQVDSTTADELYLRSKQLFVDVFKSANDVIQMDDKESKIIIGKGFSDMHITVLATSTPIQMWYTLKIQSRDGRYKYDIYDIKFKSYESQYSQNTTTSAETVFDRESYYRKNGQSRDVYVKYKDAMTSSIRSLITTIKNSMNKGVNDKKSDDW